MGKHCKITAGERDTIAWWVACGVKLREIARRLGRSHSSICAELKRNSNNGIYGSIHAHKQAVQARKRSHKKYRLRSHPTLHSYVLEKLKLGWSPEQIAGRLRTEIVQGLRTKDEYINHESIYQYLYDEKQRGEKLWAYLPRQHRKRKRWLGRRSFTAKIPQRISIRHRPEAVNNRTEFGHWEGDTLVGDKRKTGIHTEVERLSRFLFACKLPRVRAKETADAQVWLFGRLPKQVRKSTTLDNGVEHFLHTQLREELGMATYFADPYCSWQRGTNEYTNGLVRRYFPKGTGFRSVSQEQINAVVDRLNSIPRKVLNYQTPLEVFTSYMMATGRIDS
jgi:transposase, IS30 family